MPTLIIQLDAKSVSLVVSCGMAWGAEECHAEVFRQTPLLPSADVSGC
ncbi:hypothetical protein [Klebsiella pneumoniae]|nr:hypothetical protein [Klebsiella pneumoniae]